MIKDYKITKAQIIKSVMTEPLIAGDFFESYEDQMATCKVCAVGAVMRAVIPKEKLSTSCASLAAGYLFSQRVLEKAHVSGNFMSILSTEHEAFAEIQREPDAPLDFLPDLDLQRLHLLSVIEAFCPPVVRFRA